MHLFAKGRVLDRFEPISSPAIDISGFAPAHRRAGAVVGTMLAIWAVGAVMSRANDNATRVVPQVPVAAKTLAGVILPKLN